MICPKCNKKNDAEANFCKFCGAQIKEENINDNADENKKILSEKERHIDLMGGILGFLLGPIGLLLGLCLYRKKEFKIFVISWLWSFLIMLTVAILVTILYLVLPSHKVLVTCITVAFVGIYLAFLFNYK